MSRMKFFTSKYIVLSRFKQNLVICFPHCSKILFFINYSSFMIAVISLLRKQVVKKKIDRVTLDEMSSKVMSLKIQRQD